MAHKCHHLKALTVPIKYADANQMVSQIDAPPEESISTNRKIHLGNEIHVPALCTLDYKKMLNAVTFGWQLFIIGM